MPPKPPVMVHEVSLLRALNFKYILGGAFPQNPLVMLVQITHTKSWIHPWALCFQLFTIGYFELGYFDFPRPYFKLIIFSLPRYFELVRNRVQEETPKRPVKSEVRQAIETENLQPSRTALDNGYELAAIYDTILTPKRR